MGTTISDEPDDNYLNDDKSSGDEDNYRDDYDNDQTSSASTPTTEITYITSNYEIKGELGKSVTLKCNGQNFLNDTIFMWYNNISLLFQGKSKITDDIRFKMNKTDGTLTIDNIKGDDDSTYRCRAYTSKLHYETTVNLKVDGPPRGVSIFERHQKNVDITNTTFKHRYNKKDVEFSCNVAKSHTAVKIEWVHNGNTILESRDHDLKIENGNVLIIKKVHAKHAGEYQCEASNEFGIAKASFQFDVECK